MIVPVGGEGHGVVAFAWDDGRVVWQLQDFRSSQSSPILIDADGRPQLVVFVTDEITALDPANGELLWSLRHPTGASYNISTPVWSREDNLLFLSSAYGGGSRMLRLATVNGRPTVEELWCTNKMKVHFTNAIRFGGHIYAASGAVTGAILAAIDAETGEIAWRDRAVRRCNLVVADDKALIFEAGGRLLLATLSPEGVEIHAETRLFENHSWTVPTVVGRTLYARDRETMVAVELPAAD